MLATPDRSASTDSLEQHPPERGARKKKYVVVYSCCCCCCCCLHTVGAAIGASRGVSYYSNLVPPAPDKRGAPSVRMLYDTSLVIVFALVAVGVMLWRGVSEGFIFVLLSGVLAGPLWLLAGSVVMAVRLGVRTDLPAKAEYWKALGRVTWYTVLGSLIGIGVMVGLGMGLALVAR